MGNFICKIGVLAVLPLVAVLTIRPQALAAHEVNKTSEEISEGNQEKNPVFSVFGVMGELIKIEGEVYVVRESDTKKEWRLKVTSDTKIYGTIKVGQKIIVSVSSNDRVLVVTSLQ
jgi:hypothetical protein